ncbi:MAG TPA: dipeptide ABC transporter ATP-binding protein, partial [Rectinemataceae bacterium]|nr:dipeptide ABC transporter ATP-binding protein [Rectinemataceae bacterium]
GESGSGKTVTAQSALRLIPESLVAYMAGRVVFKGRDILRMDTADLRAIRGSEIGMIFQEPMSSLNPLHTVEKQLGETLFLHRGLGLAAARPVSLEWLRRVGLADAEKKLGSYPHQLSGGERQRVMIAMALANEPSLLIADEPTTALDVTIQAQILDLLGELQRELGMAVLFITHNLEIVRRIATRVAVMHDGRIVETQGCAGIFARPEHAYTRSLIDAEPLSEPPEPDPSRPLLLEARQLKVWFPIQRGLLRRTRGHVKAVDGVDLRLRRGETLGIAGESGSGKTTLGKALLRLTSSTGSISLEGERVDRLGPEALRLLRRRMQIVFQDPFGSLNPRMTVEDIIGEGLEAHGVADTAGRREAIVDTMRDVGLDPGQRLRYPHEYSGGQRQRIAIARALILKPSLLVLDEPTSSLDRSIQFQVIGLLKDLQAKYGLSYIFISHDLKVLKSLCHELAIMKDGRIVEAGPAAAIFREPEHPYTRELLTTAFGLA